MKRWRGHCALGVSLSVMGESFVGLLADDFVASTQMSSTYSTRFPFTSLMTKSELAAFNRPETKKKLINFYKLF